jgi:hypothetical protein
VALKNSLINESMLKDLKRRNHGDQPCPSTKITFISRDTFTCLEEREMPINGISNSVTGLLGFYPDCILT